MSEAVIQVGVVQLSSQDRLDENLEAVALLCRKAAGLGARLVLLPENFAFMGREDQRLELAESVALGPGETQGVVVRQLAQVARDNQVFLVAGGMPEAGPDASRPFNTSLVLSPQGEVVARYRKIHLFDVDVGDGQSYRESAHTAAGDRAEVVDLLGFCAGLSVCYDLRFPELYRALVERGAELLTVPAAFTLMTGKDHWHVLLRARAIESQCYVLAAAQQGEHPRGRRTYGKSCIVDPWGDVIAQVPDGPGVAVAEISRKRLNDVRASLPSLAHRVIGRSPSHR